MDYTHRLDFKVRDYECDLQGLVNNAVYQNYLEHARHEFLQERGINFAAITARGIHLIVVRAELDYRQSLKSNDKFIVCSNLQRHSKLRFEFLQDIFRSSDQRLMLQARIIGTALDQRGKPFITEEFDQLFSE
jgi:acyl-CoA thioester hydrolase